MAKEHVYALRYLSDEKHGILLLVWPAEMCEGCTRSRPMSCKVYKHLKVDQQERYQGLPRKTYCGLRPLQHAILDILISSHILSSECGSRFLPQKMTAAELVSRTNNMIARESGPGNLARSLNGKCMVSFRTSSSVSTVP